MGRLVLISVLLLWLLPISLLVNRIVPDPYMDEIFHVPQAQQYCRGNFRSWDPMITTPPGLYFVSLAYVASLFPGFVYLQEVSSFHDACSTSILRFTNVVLAVICSILVYEIIRQLSPSLDENKAMFRSIVLSLYPLHWFFSFLYYTDVASLTAVLAMYLLTLKKKYLFSSLLGAISVFIRQTNIIWMFFAACTGVIEFTLRHQKDVVVFNKSKEKDGLSVDSRGVAIKSQLRKRRVNNRVDIRNDPTSRSYVLMTHSSDAGLLDEVRDIIKISWHHLWELLLAFTPFLVVFVAFIAFVCWNGSIVLGAKDAHTVSPHFAQLLYYSMVSGLFMFPVQFSLGQTAVLFQHFRKNKLSITSKWFMALTMGFLSVKYFSIAHPYLLADNRHYPFYLWRKVINYHCSTKYLMVPIYIYSWFSIFSNLAKIQKKTWVLVYFMACAATLIPTPLIELRYYTIPFYLLILHIDIGDNKSWILMGLLYVLVNCFTMYMFLFRPFSWKHEAGTQRFIW